MILNMGFGDRVRVLMKKEGISQNKLAEMTEEHSTAISSYLSGRRKPKVEFIMRLIKVFPHADLNWLFRGEIQQKGILQESGAKYEIPDSPEVLVENIEANLKKLKAVLSQR